MLSGFVFAKNVRVDISENDRYGRSIGRVYVGDLDINAEMVKQGAAWVYRQYSRDPSFLAFEEQARSNKRGLWALPDSERIPPWEWRHSEKKDAKPNLFQTIPEKSTDTNQNKISCGTKTTCKQMSSCQEARFYLNECGLSRLDRDRDGIPCESICR